MHSFPSCVLVSLCACALSACEQSGPEGSASDVGPLAVADAGPDAALPWDQGGADTPEYSLARLLVSHQEAAQLSLVDLDTSSVAAELPFDVGASVFTGASGRYGYAMAKTRGAVRIIDPGQWLLSHIDHFHVIKGEVGLFDEQLEVTSLASLHAHDGWVATFDAATGSAAFFQERSLTAQSFGPQTTAQATAGDGIATISHAHLILSVRDEDDSYLSIRSIEAPDTELQRIDGCKEPRDVASDAEHVLLRCAENLLILTFQETGSKIFSERALPLTDPVGRTALHQLTVLERRARAVVKSGTDTLSVIALEEEGSPLTVRLAAEPLRIIARRQENAVVVLLADGSLSELDTETWRVTRTAAVLDRIEADDVIPAVCLSHAYAYIADPRGYDIQAFRLRSWKTEEAIPLGSSPNDVALVGMPASYTDSKE